MFAHDITVDSYKLFNQTHISSSDSVRSGDEDDSEIEEVTQNKKRAQKQNKKKVG